MYVEHGLAGRGEVVHKLFDPVLADAAQRGAGLAVAGGSSSRRADTGANRQGVPAAAASKGIRPKPS